MSDVDGRFLRPDDRIKDLTIEQLFGLNEDNPEVPPLQKVLDRNVKSTIQEQFESFHKINPVVLDLIIRVARGLKSKYGFDQCGIAIIYERLRWLYAIQTQGGEYKLANAHRAFYARVVMALCKDLEGFFTTSTQKTPYVIDWAALDIDPASPGWQAL